MILVWVKISTFLRLEDFHHHGYYDKKNLVKEWSWMKETTFGLKQEMNCSLLHESPVFYISTTFGWIAVKFASDIYVQD